MSDESHPPPQLVHLPVERRLRFVAEAGQVDIGGTGRAAEERTGPLEGAWRRGRRHRGLGVGSEGRTYTGLTARSERDPSQPITKGSTIDERICAGTAAVIHEMGRQARESCEAVSRSMGQSCTEAARAPTIAEQVADAYDSVADRTFEAACRLCALNVGEIHNHRSTGAAIFVFSDNSYASPLISGILMVGTFGEEDWRNSGRFECSAEPATAS